MLPWNGTVTNAGGNADLWEINPADDKPVRLWGFVLGQTSEVADAQEEGLRITVKRLRATVTSSNGTAGTAEAADEANLAPSLSWEYNGATVATTTGDTETLAELGWNNRQTPFDFWYPDERFCPKVVQGEALVIRLEDTVADDMTFVGMAFVEEI